MFLCAADMLGLKPEECFVVEDAEAGIRAALAGGFAPVGIGGAAKCDGIIKGLGKFSDLLEL